MKIRGAVAALLLGAALAGFWPESRAQPREGQDAPSGAASPGRRAGQVDDATLTARVKIALIREHQVKPRNIKVASRKGAVQLKGTVSSPAEMEAAVSRVQGVPGVASVDNRLTIASQGSPSASAGAAAAGGGTARQARR